MKQSSFQIIFNRPLTEDVFELRLAGDATAFTNPGQFAEISVPGLFLRRPISVCDWTPDTLTLLVKAVGTGTRSLRDLKSGASLDILTTARRCKAEGRNQCRAACRAWLQTGVRHLLCRRVRRARMRCHGCDGGRLVWDARLCHGRSFGASRAWLCIRLRADADAPRRGAPAPGL